VNSFQKNADGSWFKRIGVRGPGLMWKPTGTAKNGHAWKVRPPLLRTASGELRALVPTWRFWIWFHF
jgi:hypothetical protein